MAMSRAIRVFPTSQHAADFLADQWFRIAWEATRQKGRFSVALSGGESPRIYLPWLAAKDHVLPWNRTHIFLADERIVHPEDQDSNVRLIRENLISRIKIPEEHIHAVDTSDLDAEGSAARYEQVLKRYFSGQQCGFDMMILGVGRDGHTASLFPESMALTERRRWVIPVKSPPGIHQRVTLSLAVINGARHVFLFVSGKGKACVMKEILLENKRVPATLIQPEKGVLTFILDRNAASLLDDIIH